MSKNKKRGALMKKFLSAVLAVTLTFGTFTLPVSESEIGFNGKSIISASAEDTENKADDGNTEDEKNVSEESDFKYNELKDGTLKITGYTGDKQDVVIPSKIKDKDVTAIGNFVFCDNTNIKSVVISDGIKSIGENSFENCVNLESIEIADSVDTIKEYAFKNCSGLESIKIPDGVTEINDLTFYGCKNLTEIEIPQSVESVGSFAFSQTKWLEEKQKEDPLVVINGILISGYTASGDVEIPDNVSSISAAAFMNDNGDCEIKSVTIPNSVKKIEKTAFYNCKNLEKINIPESVENIGAYAFYNTKWLKNKQSESPLIIVNGILIDASTASGDVVIPDKVSVIAGGAFCCVSDDNSLDNNPALTGVTIPSSVKDIGKYAFYGCTNMKEITVPESVKSISDNAIGYYYSYDSENTEKIENFKIKCYTDSEAKKYASENGFNYEIADPHTHYYKSYEITKNPTCTTSGIMTVKCDCGETAQSVIPAIGHKYVDTVVAPTCTKKGYTVHKCAICGNEYKTDYTPVKAHRYKLISYTKPTLTSRGLKVYKCQNCGGTKEEYINKLISINGDYYLSNIPVQTYTGKQIKPTVKFELFINDKPVGLKKGTDYTITYGTNKIGKGTVTITGKGKYTGSITRSFVIRPRTTSATVKSSSKGKITVSVAKRAEATKYQIQYSTNSKFKNTKTYTMSGKNTSSVLKATSKKTYYIRVRTVKTIGKMNYVSSWSAVKKVKVK